MSRVYLGLGGNLGDKRKNINDALKLLQANDKISLIKTSSLYETEPVGYKNQDWFLNIVVEVETSLSPYELLSYCNEIESILKRKRLIRWGPRTIDIDILLYENVSQNDEKLTIPHPRMKERAFVMLPLVEIAPGLTIGSEKVVDIAKNIKGEGIYKLL